MEVGLYALSGRVFGGVFIREIKGTGLAIKVTHVIGRFTYLFESVYGVATIGAGAREALAGQFWGLVGGLGYV